MPVVASSEKTRSGRSGEVRYMVMAGVLLLVVLAIGGIAMFSNQRPQIRKPPSVPSVPAINAYDTYRQAAAMMVDPKTIADMVAKKTEQSYSHAEKERLLALNREPLRLLHAGVQQVYQAPATLDRLTLSRDLRAFGDLGRLRLLEGEVLYQKGQPKAAIDAWVDCLVIGRQMPGGGGFLGRVMGSFQERRGRQALWEKCEHFDGQSARYAVQRLENIQGIGVPLSETWETERYRRQAYLMDMFTSPPASFQPKRTAPNMSQRLWAAQDDIANTGQILRYGKQGLIDNLHQTIDEIQEDLKRPYPQSRPIPKRDNVNGILASIHRVGRVSYLGQEADAALLTVALALQVYHQEHKVYPDKLEELVTAGHLKAVPADPFGAGEPLRYRCEGNKSVLYSIGPDAIDDHGKLIAGQGKNRAPVHRISVSNVGDIVAELRP